MKAVNRFMSLVVFLAAPAVMCGDAGAQVEHWRGIAAVRLSRQVIIPQAGSFDPARSASPVKITAVKVGAVIVDHVATTTMEISLENPSGSLREAELVVPVPDGAVVRGFTFQGSAGEPTAKLLPKDEARKAYDAIVARIRDPALLEFVGYNLIKSSVFPVPARGTQKVRLTYEHILPVDGNRADYVLPRSESLDYPAPWEISVRIKSGRPISTVYSPSHRIETRRPAENVVSARVDGEASGEPGPFRLSYLLEAGGVSASLLAYPDPAAGGGYFLLLAGLPPHVIGKQGESAIKREVTLVIDRSGSMHGPKLEQVREAALQILEALNDGEAFNIMVYNQAVECFAEQPVLKTAATVAAARKYIETLKAQGGTNIHDALLEALRQKPTGEMLPLVLFLTDGLPTIGQTSETAIRKLVKEANGHERRVFTFGVGADVNTPLLERLASETRATATFVLPKEDVEVKVAQVFKKLAGPVLAGPSMRVVTSAGEPVPGRVRDLVPAKLPDMFEDDQLVLLGQYLGEKPLSFELSGNYMGKDRTFRFDFTFDKATTKNAFVPRLWASRKIAVLVDDIRQLGADSALAATDGRVKELTDTIVKLSTEFGILTEYTAFLAREGTDLSRRDEVLAEAVRNFQDRAVATRSGLGSVNQSINNQAQIRQQVLNRGNRFFDRNMNRVEIATVRQIGDRAFYRRGGRWVDSRIVQRESAVLPGRIIAFGCG